MTKKSTYQIIFSMMIGFLIGCNALVGQTTIHGATTPASPIVINTPVNANSFAEIPRLYGWDFKGMNWQLASQSWETEVVIHNMRQHGVNVLRRHFASAPLMEHGTTSRLTYFRRWHNVANWAAENGMWIIFDFYTRNFGGDQGTYGMNWMWQMPEYDFLAMWRIIAREMKGHGNVLLELGNEPNDFGIPDPSHRESWLQRSIQAIEVIRAEGFQGYIVIPLPEGATWGHTAIAYREQVRAADPLDHFMWDFHYYWFHHEQQAGTPDDYTMRDVQGWLDRMGISDLRATGDRVLCGEFGVHGQVYDHRDMQWFKHLIAILRRDGYDMIAEAYQPNNDFPQLIGDWEITDWHTLNTQGNTFVDALPLDIRYYKHEIGDAQDKSDPYGSNDLLLELTSLLARARNAHAQRSISL
jgi:hypothetical protein